MRDCKEEVYEFVFRQLKKAKVYVAKESKVKNGRDFYVDSNNFLRKIAKQLRGSFSGEVKLSATLHTVSKSSGKELYRLTMLFRQYPFKKGDTITVRGEEYEVLAFGTRVRVKHLKTNKKKDVRFADL